MRQLLGGVECLESGFFRLLNFGRNLNFAFLGSYVLYKWDFRLRLRLLLRHIKWVGFRIFLLVGVFSHGAVIGSVVLVAIGDCRVDRLLIVVFIFEAGALWQQSLHTDKPLGNGVEAHKHPNHRQNHIHYCHAGKSRHGNEQGIHFSSEIAPKREERQLLPVGEGTKYHRAGDDAHHAHESVGEKAYLLAKCESQSHHKAPQHHNKRRDAYAAGNHCVCKVCTENAAPV